MARYTYRWTELWRDSTQILDQELEQLAKYLHNSQLDEEFDLDAHVYAHESGDRWIFLPELTDRELFLITVILSSSTLEFENRPVRFDRPPETAHDAEDS